MKIRTGFVSNSSSTSFTCPWCASTFEGWDWDDDPVCTSCHRKIGNGSVNGFELAQWICKMNDLDYDVQLKVYLKSTDRCNDEN